MQAMQFKTWGGVLLAMACWQAASAPLGAPAAPDASAALPLPIAVAASGQPAAVRKVAADQVAVDPVAVDQSAVDQPALDQPAAVPVPVAGAAEDRPAAAAPAAPAAMPQLRREQAALGGIPAVSADRLGGLRGGTDTVNNDMKLSGVVGSNAAVNVATGANIISDGAFANASGLPIVIQNSGANVLIQNATIINLQLK